MQKADLYENLERLTAKLHQLVDEKKGNFRDPGVVAVSQELDKLILRIQRDALKPVKR